MRHMLAAAMLVLPSVAAPAQGGGIPAKFHGEWVDQLRECGGDTAVRITSRAIQGWSEQETVHSVKIVGPLKVSYTATIAHEEGEGRGTGELTMSADGKRLIGRGSQMVRGKRSDLLRCPG